MFKIDALKDVVAAERVEEGAWLHLRSPIIPEGGVEGPLLYLKDADGKPDKTKPSRVQVRSSQSKRYRSSELNNQIKATSRAQRAKLSKQDEVIADSITMSRPRQFATLVVCFDNVSSEAKGIQTPTEEELIALASQSSVEEGNYQWLVDQVMEFAHTLSNFGPEGAPPPPPPAGDEAT